MLLSDLRSCCSQWSAQTQATGTLSQVWACLWVTCPHILPMLLEFVVHISGGIRSMKECINPPSTTTNQGSQDPGTYSYPAITQVGSFEGSELFSGPSGFQFWLSWAVASSSLGQSSRTLSASWDELPVELPTCKSLYQALIARKSQTKTLMLDEY